ncbi:MAG: glycosyltransferase family 4 protein [Desulfomonilaceae bacterium]|nr:glycosyltransferase family 4 protein [Desulfomonilaceae bacterium]
MTGRLVLFFTRGVSLRTWSMVGMLHRETALYKRMIQRGLEVGFVTYGDETDLSYAKELGDIRILCNSDGLPLPQYEEELAEIHRKELERAHVVKTNQTYGADIALHAARRYDKPLIARCGYMWSWTAGMEHGIDSAAAEHARRMEETVFSAARRVVVTADAMRSDIVERIPGTESRIRVIPNYVDTDQFRPIGIPRDSNTAVFVGRLSSEKNLAPLLEATLSLGMSLVVIGEGRLRPQLQEMYPDADGRVRWEGNVPNHRLPHYLNDATVFVLPSLYEGHPKVLIEAMACGLPVLGADSPGIRDVIEHEVNGYLCSPDAKGIRHALEQLLKNPSLRAKIGCNARKFAAENYSLDRVLEMELALLKEVVVGT